MTQCGRELIVPGRPECPLWTPTEINPKISLAPHGRMDEETFSEMNFASIGDSQVPYGAIMVLSAIAKIKAEAVRRIDAVILPFSSGT